MNSKSVLCYELYDTLIRAARLPKLDVYGSYPDEPSKSVSSTFISNCLSQQAEVQVDGFHLCESFIIAM